MLYRNQIRDFGDQILICGIDEAGRGPLAGPVVVAGVILDVSNPIPGINDSKKLNEARREELYQLIIDSSLGWMVKIVSESIIDEMNILQASLYGMKCIVEEMDPEPDICLIDGNFLPKDLSLTAKAIIKGDAKYASIAAASILAKVTRDRLMIELHKIYPIYNFAKNKGYPTAEHMAAIRKFGIIKNHRRSFNPVRQIEFDF